MPDAYKCSRCGNLFEGEPYFSEQMELFEEPIELCDGCVEKFIAWLQHNEATDLTDFEQEGLQ